MLSQWQRCHPVHTVTMMSALQDLRFAIGAFFTLLGIILISLPSERAPLTTGPVNTEAGACILVFGVLMLLLAFRGARRPS